MTAIPLPHISLKTQQSEQQNAEWQAAIKSDALRKRQQSIVEEAPSSFNYASDHFVSTITTNHTADSVNKISGRIQPVSTDASATPTRRQVCEKFTLNGEQARAFYIVCRHVDGESHLKTGKDGIIFFRFANNCLLL